MVLPIISDISAHPKILQLRYYEVLSPVYHSETLNNIYKCYANEFLKFGLRTPYQVMLTKHKIVLFSTRV